MHPRFEQVEKIFPGRPRDVDAILRDAIAKERRVQDQQFQPAKERQELERIRQEARDQLTAHRDRLIGESQAAMQQRVATIDAVLANEHDVPTQRDTESDSSFAARIMKRSILETRRHTDAVLGGHDLHAITALTDPVAIEQVFNDALANRSADVFGRIALVADARLLALTAAETEYPGPGPAGKALANVRARLHQWRRDQVARTPDGQRKNVRAEHELREMNIRTGFDNTMQLFGLTHNLVSGTRLTAPVS
jgi:hypothetical protein